MQHPPSSDTPAKKLSSADSKQLPRYAVDVKSRKNRYVFSVVAFFGALLVGLLISADAFRQQSPATPSTPPSSSAPATVALRISAHAYHEDVTLKSAEFKALPHITISVHNEHSKVDETYTGVRLADLLAKMGAPLGHDLRGAALSGYIVATGSDGYVAVISLAEADPSFHSGEVFVADTMNGQPLDAKSGPFKLVVTEDKRPARWVRNLVSIELKSAR